MTRRPALTAAALASATALMLGAAPALAAVPAQAAAPTYVALGDSYSSGTGTRSYLKDGTRCERSVYAYPSLIASARGYDLNFRACSGAKIPDVTSAQLSALGPSTAHVTISVGGNDAGFANVLTTCALPAWLSNCYGAVDRAQSYIRGTLPASLDSLYASIHSRAPRATVTVVGYPRIFNGEDCNLLTWFSPTEEKRLNETADLMNAILAARAGAAGFSFADPTSRFVGHAVCDSPEWLNGLSNPITESYHPNRRGQSSGYTPAVSPFVTGRTVRATPALMSAARGSAEELADRQRQYAGVDREIEPQVVRAPDLTTPKARAAAKRAGVDLSDRASIDAADRTYATRQAATQSSR